MSGPSSAGNPHGTHVSSIAAAKTNNYLGMASVGYNSRIAAHRIYHDSSTSTSSSNIRDAIWNLYQMGIPVINVSWTGTGLDPLAAKEITENGTTLVLAGGNTPTSQLHTGIADIPGVIVVGSVDKNTMSGQTDNARNQWIDICAPGKDILFASENNTYIVYPLGATSASAPFVSGTIALMLSINPNLMPVEIEEILKSTAKPIADAHLYWK